MHATSPRLKSGIARLGSTYPKCGGADLNKQLRFAVRPVLVDLVRVAALAAGKVWHEVHPPPPERNTGTCPIRTDCSNWPYCGCDVVQRYRSRDRRVPTNVCASASFVVLLWWRS